MVKRRLFQSDGQLTSCFGRPLDQMQVGKTIKVTRTTIAAGLNHVVKFDRPQPVRFSAETR